MNPLVKAVGASVPVFTTSISSALQCAAVRCSVLQCDVVCGSVLSCVTKVSIYDLAEDVVKVVGASVPVGAGYLI